jgi:hypothetical protein
LTIGDIADFAGKQSHTNDYGRHDSLAKEPTYRESSGLKRTDRNSPTFQEEGVQDSDHPVFGCLNKLMHYRMKRLIGGMPMIP